MTAMTEICSAPYCRKPSTIIVLGKGYCDDHNGKRLEVALAEWRASRGGTA